MSLRWATVYPGPGQKRLAGSHFAQFDATGLASGVYLYRLVTDSGSLIRKMVFAK
jgi:hypothetical protein